MTKPSIAPGSLPPPRQELPTRAAALLFRLKATCFQLQRVAQDWARGGVPLHSPQNALARAVIAAERVSDLWFETNATAEQRLELGKVQNLRTAAALLDGLEVPADAVWSFWRQLGRTTARRGFAVGRELREGCLIPTLGGGLCQLSGAIYNAALEADLEVVERHRHSHPGVGALAALGRDATVFWNYVDLRLRAPFAWRLEVRLTHSQLRVQIRSERAPAPRANPATRPAQGVAAPEPGSCASCGVSECFRHLERGEDHPGRTAWLVDEWWPEWDHALAAAAARPSLLLRPLDGHRWRKPNYAWNAARFATVQSATLLTLRRAWATRRLREQGAERQHTLLAWDERLARHYAGRLRAAHTHLVISQNLLPFLWRDGVLGGRTFEVLMTRLPLHALQAQLDRAARLHAASPTCADFRAPAWIVDSEAEALAAAERWITPHHAIAALAIDRATLLPWQLPAASAAIRGERVLFPASTLGRKGAYELRAAARTLGFEVGCLGRIIEAADFWEGVQLRPPASPWLEGAAAVVLPAFVEHRPRRLLAALAAGVPVIATPQCGLGDLPGVTTIPAGDVHALTEALRAVLVDRCGIK